MDLLEKIKKHNVKLLRLSENRFREIKFRDRFLLKCNACSTIWETDKRNITRNKHVCGNCFIKTITKYSLDKNSFQKKSAFSFYLLGVMFSDGSMFKRKYTYISNITSKDIDWLEAIRDILSPGKPVYIKRTRNNCGELAICGKNFYDWLAKWNCIESKSLKIEFPELIPKKYIRDFVRGLIDGDGWISIYKVAKINTNRLEVGFCTGSFIFAKRLFEVLTNIGLNVQMLTKTSKAGHKILGREIKKDGIIYRVVSSGGGAAEVLQWAYYPGNPLAMNRKEVLANQGIELIKEKIKLNPSAYKKVKLK